MTSLIPRRPNPPVNAAGPLSPRARALVNSLLNVGGTLFSLVVWFLLTPFVIRHLGAAAFGLWVIVGLIVSYGPLADFGIGDALTRIVAAPSARAQQLGRSLTTALWIYGGLAALITFCAFLLAPLLGKLFRSGEPAGDVELVLLLAGINLAAVVVGTLPISVLRGLNRFDLINGLGTLGVIANALVIVAVLLAGGGLVELVAAAIALEVLIQVPFVLAIRRVAPSVRPEGWRPDTRIARGLLSFGAARSIVRFALVVRTRTDELILGAMSTVATVGPYAILRRLAEMPAMLSAQFVDVLLPLSAESSSVGDRERMRELVLAGVRISLAVVLFFGVGIAFLADPFITAWIGADYARFATLAPLLVLATSMSAAHSSLTVVLTGAGRQRIIAPTSAAAALAKVVLAVVLFRAYGATGLVTAGVLAAALALAPALLDAVRYVEVGLRTVGQVVFAPVLAGGAAAALVVWGLAELVTPSTLLGTVSVGAAGGAAFLSAYSLSPFTRSERHALFEVVRRVHRIASG